MAVTILKTQYLESAEIKPIGGLKEVQEYAIINAVYPEWEISLPLDCVKVTQDYSRYHPALDFAASSNICSSKEILAVDKGKVILAEWVNGYGNRIEILHENEIITTYSHLSKININMKDNIETGDVIGIMGSTGISTGVHLHFEIIYKGVKLNPKKYI